MEGASSNDLFHALATSLLQGQEQTLLHQLLDGVSDGVLIASASGTLLYANPAAQGFAGLDVRGTRPEELDPRFGVFTADTHTPVTSEQLPLYRLLRGEESPSCDLFVIPPHRPEGYYLQMLARPIRGADGGLLGALVFLRDTTRARQAEERQRRSEQRYRLIVESAQEGIWTVDPERRTTYVNDFMARMLGRTPQEMLGRDVLDFMPDHVREETLQQLEARRQGHSDTHEVQLLHKQGHVVWTRLVSNPILDEGRFVGALAMFSDISQRREAEAQIRQLNEQLERRIAERTAQLEFSNRELEAFAYSVAHDLRSPLRSISNFALALTEDCSGQLDAMGLDYLRRIHASSQRMAELIDGILSLSRVSRTALQETDVNLSALARSIAEQLQRQQPQRTARFRLQEGLVERGDPQLLRSVLENLLGNAWKFTRERPEAEISFGVLPEESPRRVYCVRDNGAGFDMAYQAKLFGVFQRLHTQQEFEGTGVGLATVQRVVRRHGGRVWAEGHVDQGATFFFTLHEATPRG